MTATDTDEADLIARALRDDGDAFPALIMLHARSLRTIIACFADSLAAIDDLQRAVWNAARVRLGERPHDRSFAIWLLELAVPLIDQRLQAADREAVNGKDPLRYSVAQAGLEELRITPVGSNPAIGLGERLVSLPAEMQDLLRRRYQEGQTVATIATYRVVADSEIAAALAGARAALDWSGLAVPQSTSADSLLPVLTEDLLGGIIDPDSRALLVASLMKDMDRNRRFVRQVRLHLVLGAWLGPLDREQARALARPGVIIGSGVNSSGDAVRSPPGSGAGRRVRQTTSNAEPRRHGSSVGRPLSDADDAEPRRGIPLPLLIAGALVVIGLIGVVSLWVRPAVTPKTVISGGAERTTTGSEATAATAATTTGSSSPRPASPALATAGVFVRGIKLGGNEVTIERNHWLSQRQALAAGLSVAPGSDQVTGIPVTGSGLDFDTKALLEGGLRAPIGELRLTQEMPNGDFAVSLWVAAAQGTPGDGVALRLGGKDVPLGQAMTRNGSWARLGPYAVSVRNQRLELALSGLRNQHLAGFTINALAPFNGALPASVMVAEPVDGGRFYANQPIVVRADVIGSATDARIEFLNGATVIGAANKPPYQFIWERPSSGRFSLSVRLAGAATSSTPVTGTVITGGGSGTILREYWTGIPDIRVAHLTASADFPDRPSGSAQETAFRSPIDWGDGYGQRMRGYLTAPLTGAYLFWIAGDDEAELWLSSDEQPERKSRIAVSFVEGNGIKPDEWERVAAQRSAPQTLVAGRRYYVEVLHKEGGGGDHVEVGWQLPDGAFERPIPGVHLSPFVPAPVPVAVAPPPSTPLTAPAPLAGAAIAPAVPPSPIARFVAGINFGGEAVMVEGNQWLGQKQAEEAASLTAGVLEVALSDIEWTAGRSANGDIHKNQTWENKPLTLRGVVYPKGLGVHAESEIVYALGGRFSVFTADVGIDDETMGRGSAIFRVFADGKSVFDSGVVNHGSPAKRVNVPVSGCKELKLVVTDGGDGNDWDHSDWGSPRLLRSSTIGGLVVKSGRRTVVVMAPKPAVDAPMRTMLTSSLVGVAKENLAFAIRVPPGRYQVYLWAMETSLANARMFEVELEGAPGGEIGALPVSGWTKYGPFPAAVEDGEMDVVLKSRKGVPQIMGIAIFSSVSSVGAGIPSAANAGGSLLVDDFEREAPDWNFVGGEEFPGAKGRSVRDVGTAHGGTGAYRLDWDFTGGGVYVGTWKKLENAKAPDLTELRFWVKTTGLPALGVRLSDGSDQLHQSSVRLAATSEWQEVVVKIAQAVGGEHWGGANDGRWHPPLKGLGLNVGKGGTAVTGTVWIDDLTMVVPAAPAKP